MKQTNRPNFLLTIVVRFIFGAVLGGVVGFLLARNSILRALSQYSSHALLLWTGLWALFLGMFVAFTFPRSRMPSNQTDSDTLDLMAELTSQDQNWARPGTTIVRKSVSIKVVGDDGQQHEYHSMEEVPPEIRSQIEALEKEAAQETGKELSVTETSRTGNAITSKIIRQKNISVYKFIDDSGVERTYHSLEEMPPEIRAAITEAENKSRQ